MRSLQSTLFVLCGAALVSLPVVVGAHEVPESHVIHFDSENGFAPAIIAIDQGDTVIFKNIGTENFWPASNIHPTHEIYPEFDPGKELAPGSTWEFRFDRAGTWKMHDHLWPQFTGEITVRAVAGEDDEPGFFSRMWGAMRGWFTDEETNPWDELITSESKEILTDDAALKAYVKKFGPSKTVQKLLAFMPEYRVCHDRAHVAGHYSYEIFGADAFRNCTGECQSGCYHGVMEFFFKDKGTANIAKNVKKLCGDTSNLFYAHQCYHGIGHGLLAWSDYDVPAALKACDDLDGLDETSLYSCYNGVFMENVVGADPKTAASKGMPQRTDHVTKYLSDDPYFPCNAVEVQYQHACYGYQTARMMQLFNGDFRKVTAACEKAPAAYNKRSCFNSLGMSAFNAVIDDPVMTIRICHITQAIPYRIACLEGAAASSFWEPAHHLTSIELCKLAPTRGEKNGCYSTIIGRARDVFTKNEDRKVFCGRLETEYQEFCNAVMEASAQLAEKPGIFN